MRVSSNTLSNALIDQLNRLTSRQTQLQSQAATGQRVTLPEDDPGAVRQVLDLQSQASSVAQYQSNIAAQQDTANASYSALQTLKKISDRLGEISTLADGTKSKQELADYGTEVSALLQQAVQVGNTQFDGSYLFGGTLSDKPPFVATTDASGNITGVTYQGNQSVAVSEIAQGVTTSAQVVGSNTSGAGQRGLFTDSTTGADLFSHMISLQSHLMSGDTTSIAKTDRSQLSADEDNILYHVSQNGVIQSRLEASASIMSSQATALNKQVSDKADADLTQTIVQLNATQNAYQAALQSGAKLMNLSLMNYLQ